VIYQSFDEVGGQRVVEKIYLYINETATYDLNQLVIDGYEDQQPDAMLASMQDLRLNLIAQQRLVELDLHSGGQVVPWGVDGELIVVEEGTYRWNPTDENYASV